MYRHTIHDHVQLGARYNLFIKSAGFFLLILRTLPSLHVASANLTGVLFKLHHPLSPFVARNPRP